MTSRLRWVALSSLAIACTRGVELGSDHLSGAAAAGAGGGVGQSCEVQRCENRVFACGDCVDNDGDARIDIGDPECFGPCDDTEESFLSSVLGQSDATCKLDCYFDGDNGSGNDDCHWSHRCDPSSVAPGFLPSGNAQCEYAPQSALPGATGDCEQLRTIQSATCLSTCLPLTPVGCDCFGCCEWPAQSGRTIWLGSLFEGAGSCDTNSLDDPTRCRPCTRVTGCVND